MLYFTVPLPVPLAPSAIAIHDSLAPAVQVHDATEVPTVTVPAPPSPANAWLPGEIVTVQAGGGGVGSVGDSLSQAVKPAATTPANTTSACLNRRGMTLPPS